ncbi:MAG: hypothetical protein IJ540_01285 [Prevotella sp.]|nr:hypothetical protein [Prevotella sp.]
MKKLINLVNALELLDKLVKGERMEGVLYIDKETGSLTFKAWNRKAPKYRRKNELVRMLEHGWVRESEERWKIFESIPKQLGIQRVIGVIERETESVKEALVDRSIIDFV